MCICLVSMPWYPQSFRFQRFPDFGFFWGFGHGQPIVQQPKFYSSSLDTLNSVSWATWSCPQRNLFVLHWLKDKQGKKRVSASHSPTQRWYESMSRTVVWPNLNQIIYEIRGRVGGWGSPWFSYAGEKFIYSKLENLLWDKYVLKLPSLFPS